MKSIGMVPTRLAIWGLLEERVKRPRIPPRVVEACCRTDWHNVNPLPLMGLNIRIPIRTPTKGRGLSITGLGYSCC